MEVCIPVAQEMYNMEFVKASVLSGYIRLFAIHIHSNEIHNVAALIVY